MISAFLDFQQTSLSNFVQGDIKYAPPELFTYSNMAVDIDEDFSDCFDSRLLASLYIPLCRLLGNLYMEKRMGQFPSVRSVAEQLGDLSSEGSSFGSELDQEELTNNAVGVGGRNGDYLNTSNGGIQFDVSRKDYLFHTKR